MPNTIDAGIKAPTLMTANCKEIGTYKSTGTCLSNSAGKILSKMGDSFPSSLLYFSLLPPCLLYTYYVGSCDYTQVEKSLPSETTCGQCATALPTCN